MKKKKFSMMLLSALLCGSILVGGQNVSYASSSEEKVMLYQHAEYKGICSAFGPGTYLDLNKYSIKQNTLSSIKIPKGYIVDLYVAGSNGKLASRTIISGDYAYLGDKWNDKIVGIKVNYYDPYDYVIEKERAIVEDLALRGVESDRPNIAAVLTSESSTIKPANQYVSLDSMIENKVSVIHAGSATLTNNMDTAQELTSQRFQLTETNTVTTATTHSVGTSVSTTATFKIPLEVVETSLGITLTASYNFSKNQTNTQTTAVTYEVPSQKIKLLPKQTVLVRAYLEKVKTSGTVNLHATVQGVERGRFDYQKLQNGNWVKSNIPGGDYRITLDEPVQGSGTYMADYGSRLVVEVTDVSTGNKKSAELGVVDSISNKSVFNSEETLILSEAPVIDMTK